MRHRAALGPHVVDRVLDHVQRRRFLVEPARKDPVILALRVAHVELDEGAGQLLHLPGGGRLAGAQPHDHIAGANRLARPKLQILGDAVALVEQPDDRNALRHRRGARRDLGDGLRNVNRFGLGFRRRLPLGLGLRHVAVARGQGEDSGEQGETAHCAADPSIEAGSCPGAGGGAGFWPPPERLISDPTKPIMSTDPWVSMMTSPCLSGVVEPPGSSAI